MAKTITTLKKRLQLRELSFKMAIKKKTIFTVTVMLYKPQNRAVMIWIMFLQPETGGW